MTPNEFLKAWLRNVLAVTPESPLDHLHQFAFENGFDLSQLKGEDVNETTRSDSDVGTHSDTTF